MIWLIGNRGMLGSEVEDMLEARSYRYTASDTDVDITDYPALRDFAGKTGASWIINCSAYTAVDAAEDERDRAFSINSLGAGNVARIARESDASLIHISTDYVFDGTKTEPYSEDDITNPIGVYGKSKLEGEHRVQEAMERYFIIRTAWLYGMNGNNFVRTMLRLFKERDEVRVVADQWGSPTYARDLAAAVLKIAAGNATNYGIYHFTDEGRICWHEFSLEIYALARRYGLIDRNVGIVPITTAEYPTKAQRPKNSYLSKDKIRSALGIECRDWRDALEEHIRHIAARK